jgi:hypothetical protein
MTPPAATAAARRAAPARRIAPAPRPQRRVSGPARPAAVPRPARPARRDAPAGARPLAWLRSLPDHRLLHRLIGGRVWIVLIGGLLVGIVTMQLALLRLNAGIGRAVERGAALEQRNAELRLAISRLSDSARIVTLGTQMGLVTPPQGSPRYVAADAGDARRALATMRVPQPAAAIPVATAVVTDPAVDPAVATTVDPAATGAAPTDATTSAPATDPTTAAPVTDTAGATGASTPAAVTPAAPAPAPAPVTAGGAAPAVVPQG